MHVSSRFKMNIVLSLLVILSACITLLIATKSGALAANLRYYTLTKRWPAHYSCEGKGSGI